MLNKPIFKYLIVAEIIAVLVLAGCGVTTTRQHPRNHVHEISVQDYRRDYDVRLSNNERRIAELKASKHHDQVLVIEIRNNNAKKRLNEFKGNSKQEWDSFSRELDHDVRGVEKSLKGFSKDSRKR